MADQVTVPGAGPDTDKPAGDAGNTGSTQPPASPPLPPQIPWEWATKNWKTLVALVIAALAVIILVWVGVKVVFPPVPPLTDTSTVDQSNTAVGAFLVQAGLVLTVVAFVPFLILSLLASFKIEKPVEKGPEEVDAGGLVQAVITAIPDLLKIPGGFGVVLVLLGTILMSVTSLGQDAEATPTPTATQSAPAGEPIATPTPSP